MTEKTKKRIEVAKKYKIGREIKPSMLQTLRYSKKQLVGEPYVKVTWIHGKDIQEASFPKSWADYKAPWIVLGMLGAGIIFIVAWFFSR